MKPNSNNKKVITLYLKQLKTTLMCSASMKKVILSDVKHQISELEDQLQVLEEEDCTERLEAQMKSQEDLKAEMI